MGRLKNKVISKLLTRFPGLADRVIDGVETKVRVEGVPWTPLDKPLSECTVGIVTTAGVHLKNQDPFDMEDPEGDASFRELPSTAYPDELAITHDYYDHADADRDLDVVYPVTRLRELAEEGVIKAPALVNYGFMGHIEGPHLKTLMEKTAPEVARSVRAEGVNVVVLTPG